MKALLFTTPGCHLCEQARGLLETLRDSGLPVEIEAVEIAGSAALMEQYGVRIPVVKLARRNDDLAWPFTRAQLETYLRGEKL